MTEAARRAIATMSSRYAGLDLVVLFGSRARGDAGESSDWDLGYLARERFDREGFLADVVARLGTEQVDLVDLERAGGLIRFRAARDGIPMFQRRPDAFARFWFEAVSFWCDAGPVIRAGYDDLLAELRG
ncbi:MAG TPA: nucleotidyltransferase domain-containing protein [Longimicrobiaceae bacterium]|nr:nucleotidyltransferase domain-containing protein [Longimicrobiaceae bacterium]